MRRISPMTLDQAREAAQFHKAQLDDLSRLGLLSNNGFDRYEKNVANLEKAVSAMEQGESVMMTFGKEQQ